MILCHERNRFLFEVRPDLLPYGRLTALEQELWGYFYEDLEQRRKHGRS